MVPCRSNISPASRIDVPLRAFFPLDRILGTCLASTSCEVPTLASLCSAQVVRVVMDRRMGMLGWLIDTGRDVQGCVNSKLDACG